MNGQPQGSETIYRGRVFTVRRDRVQLPGGRSFSREVVEHPGAVVLVPLTADGRLVLVSQYRHAAGETLLELPAGTLEPGERPEETAERELQEETGFKPGRLTPLGRFFSAPGFCTELLHCFLAEDLEPLRLEADDDEAIEVVTLALAEVLQQALSGRIRDAKTLAALLLFAGRRGLLEPGRLPLP